MRRTKPPQPPPPTIRARGKQIAAAAREWLAAFKPKERIPLSEWMADHARLDDGGRFYAFPFQNAIADAFTDP